MRHSSSPANAAAVVEPLVWPLKKEAVVDGDLLLGGLMMVHSREDTQFTCGPIMAQGGIQTVETMLYTLDQINKRWTKFKIGALILDDCDKDTYGLEMAIDFIKGQCQRRDIERRFGGSFGVPVKSYPRKILPGGMRGTIFLGIFHLL
jgi:metabotropic X receptor